MSWDSFLRFIIAVAVLLEAFRLMRGWTIGGLRIAGAQISRSHDFNRYRLEIFLSLAFCAILIWAIATLPEPEHGGSPLTRAMLLSVVGPMFVRNLYTGCVRIFFEEVWRDEHPVRYWIWTGINGLFTAALILTLALL